MADYCNLKIKHQLKNEKAEFMKELGARIKDVRLCHNLTQTEFAAALSIRMNSLSRIENGEKQPSGRLLFALESYFAVNGDWLIAGKGAMLENKNWRKEIENAEQFLRMFNRLSESYQEKIKNILKMLIKAEYVNKPKRGMEEGASQRSW